MLSDRCLSVCLSILSVCGVGVLWPNGWMVQDATWYGGRPRPRRLCVRWGPSSPPKKGAEPPSQFSAHVYCGHGRPSQLLLSSCWFYRRIFNWFSAGLSRLVVAFPTAVWKIRGGSNTMAPPTVMFITRDAAIYGLEHGLRIRCSA